MYISIDITYIYRLYLYYIMYRVYTTEGPTKKWLQQHAKKRKKWLQPGSNDFNLYPFNSLLENKKPSN